MIRKFDILFSFHFTHDFFRDEVFRGFELIPTLECSQLMRNYDLLFKKKGDQFVVLCQKVGNDANNLTVIRKIDKLLKFSFRLVLKDNLLPNFTKFGGTSPKRLVGKQLFYFNNIDQTSSQIDKDMTATDNQLAMTINPTVSFDDQLFLTPAKFTLPLAKKAYDKIQFKSKASTTFQELPQEENQQSPNLVATLNNYPLGAYDLNIQHHTDPNQAISLMVYTAEQNLTISPPFGIIDIYQNEQIDYSFEKAYFLQFARKNAKRRYFIVNASERTIPLNGDESPKMLVKHPNLNYAYLPKDELVAIDPRYQQFIDSMEQDFFVFQSPFDIPLYQKEIPDLELVLNNETIIENLPGANIYSAQPNDIFVHI